MGDKIEVGDLKNVQGLAVGEGATAEIHHHYPSPPPPPISDRNRENYLNALKTTWIDGFLHQSLHSEVIKLTMTEADGDLLARDARQRSWGMVKRQAGQADEQIPLDKSVDEIFEESGRGLLILGDPGSGKTITLLQLAEQLMNAAASPDQLMPVVLNLSSWGQTRPPLMEWLVEEIFVQYGVGRTLARTWIEANQFVYLLDGLDEVAADARDECIEAINAFRADRTGVVEMAVCSRTADYEQLTARLNLTAAIQIQPLTDVQVDAYLRQPKLEMQAVQATLKIDPTLRDLTRSPLWLNVMTLAYRGKTRAELGMMAGVDARRTHLFDTYIDAMFDKRPLPAHNDYSETDARHWLVEVAHGLTIHKVSELSLEKLQPSWLPARKSHRQYAIFYGLIYGSLVGLQGGLIGGLFVGLFGLLFGGLIGGLIRTKSKIEPVEELLWQPPPLYELFGTIKDGVFVGAILGLPLGLLLGLISVLIGGLSALFFGFLFGFLLGLCIGLLGGLNGGLNDCFNVQETLQKVVPNQGIRSSRRNLWRMSMLYSIVFGALATLFYLLLEWLVPDLVRNLHRIIMGGVILVIWGTFLTYGGDAVIKHCTLRWVLARQNILPYPFSDKKLITYFDAMVERLLLRRVGNGYMFIHRTLMEHFAAKHDLA